MKNNKFDNECLPVPGGIFFENSLHVTKKVVLLPSQKRNEVL